MKRAQPLMSPQGTGGSGGAFPGAFDDEPIPLSGGGPQPVQPKIPNALRPREPQPVLQPTPQPVAVPRPTTPAPAAPGAIAAGPAEVPPKIRAFEQRIAGKHEDKGWARTPNVSGNGAIHVRSFHCKLNGESLEFLDQQINEWLDAHPQYEVKFVTTGVGEWVGKVKEPNLIVQVWV